MDSKGGFKKAIGNAKKKFPFSKGGFPPKKGGFKNAKENAAKFGGKPGFADKGFSPAEKGSKPSGFRRFTKKDK